jgi:hypothetical protein
MVFLPSCHLVCLPSLPSQLPSALQQVHSLSSFQLLKLTVVVVVFVVGGG